MSHDVIEDGVAVLSWGSGDTGTRCTAYPGKHRGVGGSGLRSAVESVVGSGEPWGRQQPTAERRDGTTRKQGSSYISLMKPQQI
jgi:hypothetical protein